MNTACAPCRHHQLAWQMMEQILTLPRPNRHYVEAFRASYVPCYFCSLCHFHGFVPRRLYSEMASLDSLESLGCLEGLWRLELECLKSPESLESSVLSESVQTYFYVELRFSKKEPIKETSNETLSGSSPSQKRSWYLKRGLPRLRLNTHHNYRMIETTRVQMVVERTFCYSSPLAAKDFFGI
jgi:hypothetical protein